MQAGVREIDIRTRETVSFFEPPYETEQQQVGLANMKKHWIDDDNYRARTEELRRDFLAGGGDPDDFDELQRVGDNLRKVQLRQMEDGTFFICGAYPIYIIKGRKPA